MSRPRGRFTYEDFYEIAENPTPQKDKPLLEPARLSVSHFFSPLPFQSKAVVHEAVIITETLFQL